MWIKDASPACLASLRNRYNRSPQSPMAVCPIAAFFLARPTVSLPASAGIPPARESHDSVSTRGRICTRSDYLPACRSHTAAFYLICDPDIPVDLSVFLADSFEKNIPYLQLDLYHELVKPSNSSPYLSRTLSLKD
jgi:hypothetical protein